jgi:hypothetical protein
LWSTSVEYNPRDDERLWRNTVLQMCVRAVGGATYIDALESDVRRRFEQLHDWSRVYHIPPKSASAPVSQNTSVHQPYPQLQHVSLQDHHDYITAKNTISHAQSITSTQMVQKSKDALFPESPVPAHIIHGGIGGGLPRDGRTMY